MACLNVDIWSYYLDYIRRMNNLSTGGTQARSVISQAYEFVLQHVGIDLTSGSIWSDYLAFLKTGPASSTWEEQQRNDLVRKTYQRAVMIPLNNVETLWRDYSTFENAINKQTARKFLNEKSPAYMTARACAKELSTIIEPLRVAKFPSKPTRTPPEVAYLAGWRRWVALERSDPLGSDAAVLRQRVKYAYKQSLMWCRYFPEMWHEAASYLDSINEESSGMYKDGLTANPKSWLLSFAYAESEEMAGRTENVKTTYDALIASNDEQISQVEAEAQKELDAAKAVEAPKIDTNASDSSSDDEEDEAPAVNLANTKKIEDDRDKRVKELAEEGTVAYVMYMRATRRIEGIKAARQIFARCIKSPHHTWHIYVASALMEHQASKESTIAIKIFARGLKSFPENAEYVLEYLNFLLSIRDDTNARALFEQTTAKLAPEKARPLFARWYEYESMYGDLASAQKLALRMGEIEPNSNPLTRFGQRFSYLGCDPIATRDLGLKKLSHGPRRGLPPHPLAFAPIPTDLAPPPPGTNGFNPPLLRPDLQTRTASASPMPQPPVPLPPPIHPSIMNLIRDLPPANALDPRITFNYKEIAQIMATIDVDGAKATLRRSVTPQVPTKRSAQSMIPAPDDVIALGRHNDPRDPYKKRL